MFEIDPEVLKDPELVELFARQEAGIAAIRTAVQLPRSNPARDALIQTGTELIDDFLEKILVRLDGPV